MDNNDLLSTNTFIPNPDLIADNNADMQDNFKKFYIKKEEQKNNETILKKVNLDVGVDIGVDSNNILNTNKLTIMFLITKRRLKELNV